MAYRFQVALSFAGSDRSVARALRDQLRTAGIAVFFDEDYEHEMVGVDGSRYLRHVYTKESQFCVVLISQQYDQRAWTDLEREAIQARELSGETGVLLPVKLDGHNPDWLPATRIYFDLSTRSLAGLVTLLQRKLDGGTTPPNTQLSLKLDLRKDRLLDTARIKTELESSLGKYDSVSVEVVKGETLRELEEESHQVFSHDLHGQLETACEAVVRAWLNGKLTISSESLAVCLHWTCRIARDEIIYYLASRVPTTSPYVNQARALYEATSWNHVEWSTNVEGMNAAARFFEWPTVKAIQLRNESSKVRGIVIDSSSADDLRHFQSARDFPEHTLARWILPQVTGVRPHRGIGMISDDSLRLWVPESDSNYPHVGHAANA